MKAFLLAAGLGTRLRPITDTTPKCLVPVDGDPLLEIWLNLLSRHGVDEVLLNTHHLAAEVEAFARTWHGPPALRLSHEPTLLGSAGTLLTNLSFVEGEDSFLVCYADNLTDMDLSALMRFHRGHDGLLTMSLFRSARPTACGIAELGPDDLVVGFEEKPESPRSNLANAGIYVMRPGIGKIFPGRPPADIGFDVLPKCVGDMYGWVWNGFLSDIGDPAAYRTAQAAWTRRSESLAPRVRKAAARSVF